MKKLLILIAAILGFYATANAQLISFGVKGGVGFSSLKLDASDITNPSTSTLTRFATSDNMTGFHVGGAIRVKPPILPIYAQVELLYTRLGSKINIENYVGGDFSKLPTVTSSEAITQRFDVPLLVGGKVGPARIFLGPVASMILSNGFKDVLDAAKVSNPEDALKSFTWAGQAGIGADFMGITADVKYEFGLSKLGDKINSASGQNLNFAPTQNQVIVSVGYFF